MNKIENKVALVTGSSSGLGKALALELCNRGAFVVLNGRDSGRLETTVSEFKDLGFPVSFVCGDVSVPADCRKIVEHCVETFGKLDFLISNAGLGSGGTFADTTPETFKMIFDINTLGAIYITGFALPYIRESKGSIVFISSLAGLVGLPYSSLYCGSKMALTAIAQSLQIEMQGTGVHVGIVYAGFLKNGESKYLIGPDGSKQKTGERNPKLLQPLSSAARSIIRVIEKRKRKIVMSPLGKFLNLMLRVSPWMVRWVLKSGRGKAQKLYEPQA